MSFQETPELDHFGGANFRINLLTAGGITCMGHPDYMMRAVISKEVNQRVAHFFLIYIMIYRH